VAYDEHGLSLKKKKLKEKKNKVENKNFKKKRNHKFSATFEVAEQFIWKFEFNLNPNLLS